MSLPPAMLREMQRTGKRENRTLSELVRENFWRTQQQSQLDIYQLIRYLAPPPPQLQAMWDEATRKGTDKLTMAQINREVRAVRRQRDSHDQENHQAPAFMIQVVIDTNVVVSDNLVDAGQSAGPTKIITPRDFLDYIIPRIARGEHILIEE